MSNSPSELAEPFHHETRGRSPRTLAVLATVYLAFTVLYLYFDASSWIVISLILFTLPAVWDVLSNRVSGLQLIDGSLRWFTGCTEGETLLIRVEKVRLDTRLDFSVRVTLVFTDGNRLRLPYECLPPHRLLESALQDHGVTTERHHFTLL